MKPLTKIELEVLRGTSTGETYAETAHRIFITEKSVSNVATRIMRKLGAKSMPHAVHLGWETGVLRRERHGDHAGFTAHVRRGEDPWACPHGCPEGERAYRTARRRARQNPNNPQQDAA